MLSRVRSIVRMRADLSHIWAHETHPQHATDSEALPSRFETFLETGLEDAVMATAGHAVRHAELAVFWSRMFMAAAVRGGPLAGLLVRCAAQPGPLLCVDTRKDAIDLVASAYGSLQPAERVAFEDEMIGYVHEGSIPLVGGRLQHEFRHRRARKRRARLYLIWALPWKHNQHMDHTRSSRERPAVVRVTFISCVDADAKLPLVSERTRVDLGRLRTNVDRPTGPVLYLKGKLLSLDDPSREEQIKFDDKLLNAGIISEDGRGPSYDDLRQTLRVRREQRYDINSRVD